MPHWFHFQFTIPLPLVMFSRPGCGNLWSSTASLTAVRSHIGPVPQLNVDEVSRSGTAVRHSAGKQKGLGLILLRLSLPFKKVVVNGHCLVTLSLTINETLKWLSLLPILMQESFWWRQCSDGSIISLFPHLYTPFSGSLISLVVCVDVKHHVH